jgi:hypothetical protein
MDFFLFYYNKKNFNAFIIKYIINYLGQEFKASSASFILP